MIPLVLLAILPHSPPVVTDRVDRIELNHVHCQQTGREVLSQVIYWRWSDEHSRYSVAAWRTVDRRP